jgi:hypothetical protein
MVIQIKPRAYYLFFIAILVCGCEKESTTAPGIISSSSIYLNSFESPDDTAGWQGYAYGLYADAPIGGGENSLYVSGGCIIPHAYINLQNKSSFSSYIKLRCWGKRIDGAGGGASLSILNNPSKSIYCSIRDSAWTHYESTDSIFCASGDTLHLELVSGGIVTNSMLIDMIDITLME